MATTTRQPGGLFVKPGIGVLRRVDDTRYNHSKPYEIANGGKWDVKRGSDSIEFRHTLSEPSIDFGYVYTKVIRLTKGKPQMTIEHVLKNTGTKPIVTNVYDHNFMTLDHQPPGPDYEISFPFQTAARAAGAAGEAPAGRGAGRRQAPPAPGPRRRRPDAPLAARAESAEWLAQCGQPQMQELANPQGNRLVYTKTLEGVECFQTSFTGFAPTSPITRSASRTRRSARACRSPATGRCPGFGYWSIRTVLAPEPYVDVNVEPGQAVHLEMDLRLLPDEMS